MAADLNRLFPFSCGTSCQPGQLNHQSRRHRPLACRDSFSGPTVSTPASLSVNTAVCIPTPVCHATAVNHRLRMEARHVGSAAQFISDHYCT